MFVELKQDEILPRTHGTKLVLIREPGERQLPRLEKCQRMVFDLCVLSEGVVLRTAGEDKLLVGSDNGVRAQVDGLLKIVCLPEGFLILGTAQIQHTNP